MFRGLLVVVAIGLVSTTAEAQKRCTKGISCGNSCIAANKTCRIGSSAPTPRIEEGRVSAPAAARADSAAPFVGSSRGKTYYKADCAGAKDLSPANLITFKSEAEAKQAGYRRSRQKGC